jgi:hypothetical protein
MEGSEEFPIKISVRNKGHIPLVPLTKALALMKKIEQDPHLHRYVLVTFCGTYFITLQCNKLHSHDCKHDA